MAATIQSTTPEAEHPDAPEIRRQVEYYFSDENLATDLHLLQCCGGRENLPVSISRISGFKKMRQFKPKSIVSAALRKSAFLVVSEDGKQVSRKVPLRGPCALDPDFYTDDEIAYDPKAKPRAPAAQPVQLLPQKKPVYPPGMSKNLMKPTGFEDTYIEGPIQPKEAEEEDAMYDPDKDFVERIEIAIQRFKQKRRMHERYANIFSKWMRFGGVESDPRMFGGLSNKDMSGMDAEEIARAKATHQVPWSRADPKQWVVDFSGVAESFLSTFFPLHYDSSPQQIKTACQVLRSFYNYLIYHSVCPEYRDDLNKALKVCDVAEKELSKVYTAGLALPGSFNEAASTIFGGSRAGIYNGDMEWVSELQEEGVNLSQLGVKDEVARITFRTAVAILGTDEQQSLINTQAVKVLEDELTGLEIVSITPSNELTREMYAHQNGHTARKIVLQPLGRLVCRTFYFEDASEYDLPKDKYPDGCLPKANSKQYEFWIEDAVLEDCFVGMKLEARVLTLEGGIAVLDDVSETMCSFYKWLPNELWMARHPKEVVIRKTHLDETLPQEHGVGDEGDNDAGNKSDDADSLYGE